DVGADPAFLHPQVPAAVIVLIVHAREDSTVGSILRKLDPGTVREGLILVEVANVGDFEGGARLGFEGMGGDVAAVPGGHPSRCRAAGLAVYANAKRAAVAVAQAGVQAQLGLRNQGGDLLRLGAAQPLLEITPRRLAAGFHLPPSTGQLLLEGVPARAILG